MLLDDDERLSIFDLVVRHKSSPHSSASSAGLLARLPLRLCPCRRCRRVRAPGSALVAFPRPIVHGGTGGPAWSLRPATDKCEQLTTHVGLDKPKYLCCSRDVATGRG